MDEAVGGLDAVPVVVGGGKSALLQSQQIIEQNEDIIAAIVENLQLGRLDDCVKHYTTLQTNLVSLALELDNYPPSGTDPYAAVDEFPDEIIRKDILDDFIPHGQSKVPKSALPAACIECMNHGISAEQCRIQLSHVGLSHTFTINEREQFLKVAFLMSEQHKQMETDSLTGIKYDNKSIRKNKKWSKEENYTIFFLLGKLGRIESSIIADVIGDRSEESVRCHIKHLAKHRKIEIDAALKGNLPPPPLGYLPPSKIAHLFSQAAAASSGNSNGNSLSISDRNSSGNSSSKGRDNVLISRLAPTCGDSDKWKSLITIATTDKKKTSDTVNTSTTNSSSIATPSGNVILMDTSMSASAENNIDGILHLKRYIKKTIQEIAAAAVQSTMISSAYNSLSIKDSITNNPPPAFAIPSIKKHRSSCLDIVKAEQHNYLHTTLLGYIQQLLEAEVRDRVLYFDGKAPASTTSYSVGAASLVARLPTAGPNDFILDSATATNTIANATANNSSSNSSNASKVKKAAVKKVKIALPKQGKISKARNKGSATAASDTITTDDTTTAKDKGKDSEPSSPFKLGHLLFDPYFQFSDSNSSLAGPGSGVEMGTAELSLLPGLHNNAEYSFMGL